MFDYKPYYSLKDIMQTEKQERKTGSAKYQPKRSQVIKRKRLNKKH